MSPDRNASSAGHTPIAAVRVTDAQSLDAAINEDVRLQSHDPAWADAFALERARLEALLPGVFVAIEHIGSTAVAGLPAKPIVDIMAGVLSLDGVQAQIDRLCDSGYTTSAEFNASLTDRKWLMRWRNGHRTHHLHIVVRGGTQWNDRLAFRDALRREPALMRQYAELKAALAARHSSDREAYTDAKAPFVRAVVAAESAR